MESDGTPPDLRTPYRCYGCGGYFMSADARDRHECSPDLLRAFVEGLEREVREARLMLAAIVTQHGENLGNGRHRLSVDPAYLETAEARQLSVINDPNSGAVLLRVRPL